MFELILFALPAILFGMIAHMRVKRAFKVSSKQSLFHPQTGAEVARQILNSNGLHNVRVEAHHGYLTDHYDPQNKVLRLSQEVYGKSSVAAAGIAAHEAGHALQDAKNYPMLRFRSAVVPFAQVGSWISTPIIMIGITLTGFGIAAAGLTWIGIILYLGLVIFQLITLPVEFDASARAKKILLSQGIVTPTEMAGVNRVLNAAAMTYVAATAQSIAWLLYFVMIARSGE